MKLIKPFILPPTLIAIGLFITLLFFWNNKKRAGMIVLSATFIFYYFLSIPPTEILLSKSFEQYAIMTLPSLEKNEQFDAIVILAGGADVAPGSNRAIQLSGASWQRLRRGLTVYRHFNGSIPILYSGDSGDPFLGPNGEGELAKRYALEFGVPEEQFWVEDASRTTWESGFAVAKFLNKRFPQKPHRIILISSLWHLPRSLDVMHRVGIEVFPVSADEVTRVPLSPLSLFPSAEIFASSVFKIHEMVGRMVYKLRWIIRGGFDESEVAVII